MYYIERERDRDTDTSIYTVYKIYNFNQFHIRIIYSTLESLNSSGSIKLHSWIGFLLLEAAGVNKHAKESSMAASRLMALLGLPLKQQGLWGIIAPCYIFPYE